MRLFLCPVRSSLVSCNMLNAYRKSEISREFFRKGSGRKLCNFHPLAQYQRAHISHEAKIKLV